MVSPERRGLALAMITGGLTVSTVLGAPLGALVGDWLGWRAPLWLVAVFGLVACAGAARVPARPLGGAKARPCAPPPRN
ncbi:MFS transporter [Streptomyces sp. TM32]|uniref:MFS transporter n=1 Tax=Streptomyces sp. TM32 TaxID=1652669 RepID=UPI0010127EF3|nr:MFS transporter [Streptomyces sp. TM32]RXS84900.1 MFS transporter [Streptomyces sp. TM32]